MRFQAFDPVALVPVAVILATVGFVWIAWRRRVSAALLSVAGLNFFGGSLSFLLMALHTGAVLGAAFAGKELGDAGEFRYDFRFYSLVLVGVAIAVPGFLVAFHAAGLNRGDAKKWRAMLWASGILAAVNLPLIPIQGFAMLLGGLALVNLAGLVAVRKRLTPRGNSG